MANERKEIEENYTYILKVMEKARKMFIEEEEKSVSKVQVDGSGNVTINKASVG